MKHREAEPQENCRAECIKFALASLCPDKTVSPDLNCIKNTLGTVDLFKSLGLETRFLLPPLAFLLPFSWTLLIRHRKNVCFGKTKLAKFTDGFQKVAYIYHLTPDQLYGYADNWTHCVCESFVKGQRKFFDSIDPEFGKPIEDVEWPPSHQTLVSHWGIIICVGVRRHDMM